MGEAVVEQKDIGTIELFEGLSAGGCAIAPDYDAHPPAAL